MRRLLKRLFAGLLGIAGLVYAADYAALEWKLHRNEQPFADVVVDQVYTSTNKWKEVEWSRGTPLSVRCVYALFPHLGNGPCWYVERHTMNVNSTD